MTQNFLEKILLIKSDISSKFKETHVKVFSDKNYTLLIFSSEEEKNSEMKNLEEFKDKILCVEEIQKMINTIIEQTKVSEDEKQLFSFLKRNTISISNQTFLPISLPKEMQDKIQEKERFEVSEIQIFKPQRISFLNERGDILVLFKNAFYRINVVQNKIGLFQLLAMKSSVFLKSELALFFLKNFDWSKCLQYSHLNTISIAVQAFLQGKEVSEGVVELNIESQNDFLEAITAVKFVIKHEFNVSADFAIFLKVVLEIENQISNETCVCHVHKAFERFFSLQSIKDLPLTSEFFAEANFLINEELALNLSGAISNPKMLLDPLSQFDKKTFLGNLRGQEFLNPAMGILSNNFSSSALDFRFKANLQNDDEMVCEFNSKFFAILRNEKKEVEVWNCSLFPFKLKTFNLSLYEEDCNDYATVDLDSSDYNDFNILFEGEKQLSPELLMKRNPPPPPPLQIEPDLVYAEMIYSMGFDINSAKEALIQVKNKGVDEAIEWILSHPTTETKAKEAKETKILKENWICSVCTLTNTNSKNTCEACNTQAPLEAYTDLLEGPCLENDNPMVSESEKKNEKVEGKKVSEKCSVEMVKIIPIASSISPFLIVAILKSENRYFLRIKQVIFNQDLIYKFVFTHANGFSSNITKEWITGNRWGEIVERILDGNEILGLDSLLPFIHGNADSVLKVARTIDYEIGSQKVIDFACENLNTEIHFHFVNENNEIISIKLTTNLIDFKPISFLDFSSVKKTEDDKFKQIAILEKKICCFSESFFEFGNKIWNLPENETFFKYCKSGSGLMVSTLSSNQKSLYLIRSSSEKIPVKPSLMKIATELNFSPCISFPSQNCVSSIESLDFESYTKHFFVKGASNRFDFSLRSGEEEANVLILSLSKNPFSKENAENPTTNKNFEIHANQSIGMLPLQIIHHEGACLSSTFVPSVILMENKEVFVSNYPKPCFVFAHLHEMRMKIHSFTVQSNLMTLNGGVLLGEGLIFVSDSVSHFLRAKNEFQSMDYEAYLQWKEQKEKKESDSIHSPWEPAAAFCIGEKEESVTVTFASPKEGKYIFLLPTNCKKSNSSTAFSFQDSPTELSHFSVKGSVCDFSSQNSFSLKKVSGSEFADFRINKKSPLSVFLLNSCEEENYSTILLLCEKSNDLHFSAEISGNNSVSASLAILSEETVDYLRFPSKAEDLVSGLWGNSDHLEENLHLINQLSNIHPEIIAKIANKIWVSNFLEQLLTRNNPTTILKNSSVLLSKVDYNLLKELFIEKISDLRRIGISREGLDAFFGFLNGFGSSKSDNSLVVSSLILELQSSISRMSTLRNQDYYKLRCHYKFEEMVFENSLFSLENVSKSAISSEEDLLEIPYTVTEIKENPLKKFSIDLQRKATVRMVKLYFSSKQESERLLVKIFGFEGEKKVLLRNALISEATAYFLSEFGGQVKAFPENQDEKILREFNVFGISISPFECSKLEIQICSSLPVAENKNILLPSFPKVLVSNFAGEPIPLAVAPRMTYIKEMNFGNVVASRYESSEGNNSVFYMVNVKKPQTSNENFNALNETFSKLQSEVIELVRENSQSSKISSKIQEIVETQKALFASEFIQKTHLCYDFEYSLCFRICRCLFNLFSFGNCSLDNKEIFSLSLNLFENLILLERGKVYEEAIQLLSKHLIRFMDKPTYHKFIVQIFETFLCLSKQKPGFSFKKVIEVVFEVGVPVGETLYWLCSIIKEPVTKQNDAVVLITSILILINKSFSEPERIPFPKAGKASENVSLPNVFPVGVRRSVSHPLQSGLGFGSLDFPLPELNDQQKLSASTKITIWICQSSFPESDKVSMLLLAMGLLRKLIDSSSISSLHDILANPNDFFSLVLHCLKLGSENLSEKLKEILLQILEPKVLAKLDESTAEQNDKLNVMAEKSKYESLKLLLISHLKTMVEGALLFAKKPEKSTIYSQIIGETSPTSWVEHIIFLLDFLMIVSNRFSSKCTGKKEQKKPFKLLRKNVSTANANVEEKVEKQLLAEETKFEPEQEEEVSFQGNFPLPPVGINRSLSHGQNPSFAEEGDKEGHLPITLALSLVELLCESLVKEGFSFENFPKVWFLVLKAVQRVKLANVIETKIFDNLVEAYLAAPEETQQTVLPELLKLSKNLVLQPTNQKDTCSLVLKALFTVIEKVRLHNSLSFSLLRGLLDILLTKSTPKPEEFYTKPFEKAFCKLNKEGALVVLDHVANFLQNYVNLGGRDGAKMASQSIVQDLILADDLLKLLTKSESSPDTLALTEITTELERARVPIRKLIQWYILNKMNENGDSPSTELLHSISNAVLKIFTIFSDFEELVKLCLHELISICQDIDQMVFNELTISQISNQIANVIIQRSCKVLDELLNLWVTTDSIASYVAFEVKGFDFLLDRLGLPSCDDKRFSYIENTDLELEDRIAPVKSEEQKDTGQVEEVQAEEFANKIVLIQKPGQNFAGIQNDWSINKKGSKGRVLLFSMFQEYYSEYPLVISLEKTCELREIKMGFNLVSTDYANKILGAPSAVLVEGGLDLKNLVPLGILEPISDEGYSNFSVRVYLKNFATTRGSNFSEGIKSLSSKRVKFLKFKIWRPIVTFIEGSSVLYGRIYKNINVSVSFLSIIGYDVTKLPAQLKSHMIDSQKTSSLQVIGKLCNPNFNETLNILSHKPDVVMKLRNSFDHFSHLLLNHENWLSPVFLALSTNNPELGDYLLDKLFDLNMSQPHSKLALEIMAATPEKSIERIQKLHAFIIKSLYEISKHEIQIRIVSLMAFVEAFCSSLSLATFGIKDKIVLQLKDADLREILNLFEEHKANASISKTLTKLFITLTNPPLPFVPSDDSLIIKYLFEIHKKSLEIPIYCEILSPLFSGNRKCAEKLLENEGTMLESLVSRIENLLQKPEEDSYNIKSLKLFFTAVNSAVLCDNSTKKWVTENSWHIKLYTAMKTTEGQKIFKDLGTEVVSAMVDFVRNVIVGSAKAEQSFADILISDLTNLESKRDNLYVTQFLTPLLNAELFVPVCINAYDSQRSRWITDGCKITESGKTSGRKNNLQQTLDTMNSKLFSPSQKEALFNMFKKRFTSKNALHKNIIKSQFVIAETQNEDMAPYLLENIHKSLKQGPFLIILSGTNSSQECICGFFSAKPLNDKVADNSKNDYVADESYAVPFCEDSFFFYYEGDNVKVHIMAEANTQDVNSIASLSYFEEGGGGLSIYHRGVERIFLSYSAGNMAYVDINLVDMKPEETENVPNDIPADFLFRQCEYWVLKPKEGEKNIVSSSCWSSNVLIPSWYSQNNPLNYYRPLPVYMVPATMTIDKMAKHFFTHLPELMMKVNKEKIPGDTQVFGLWEFSKRYPTTNNILDLEFDIHSVSDEKNEEGEEVRKRNLSGSVSYLPKMSVFDAFQRKGGVDKIIYVILKSLTLWKNKKKAQRWFLWIKELCFFSSLPHFFNFFIKNKENVELLFEILAGKPDDDEKSQVIVASEKSMPAPKKWEDEENKAIKYTYQVLSDVFKFDNDHSIRDFAIQKKLLDKLLERVAGISKEEPRRWQQETVVEKTQPLNDNSALDELREKDLESEKKTLSVKKKGIGYASDNTGQNQKWNVSEYYESQKSRSDQLQGLITILDSFLDLEGWNPPQKLLEIICSSALLPLLESAFRSGSLLDMSKDNELFTCYLSLVRTISKHKTLIPCLLKISHHYKPQQTDSIFDLLERLKGLSEIFLHCIKDESTKKEFLFLFRQSSTTQELAENIFKTYLVLEEAIENYNEFRDDISENEEQSEELRIKSFLQLPLAKAYPPLLNDLRFDYMNMKDETLKFVHHYAFNIPNGTPPPAKMVRLAQELADLSTALPCEHTNSIFVRCDESRLDVMKALIMGSAGTPYGHGAFEFDIYFDDSYPNTPPKVNLTTTGNGRVRFNPNLYSCGKVCLSLLGTWRGNATENWDPKLSTLLQVLLSLQSIIMSEEVYFNEPGFEGEAGTDEGEKKNQAYSNIVRYCNIKFAMIDQIKTPSPGFEVPIRRHFYLKKDEIMLEVNKWLEQAEFQEASYSGLVCDHNNFWCQEFRKTSTRYVEMLKEAIAELDAELKKLEAPSSKEVSKRKFASKKGKRGQKAKKDVSGAVELDEVDVAYDEVSESKQLDVNDDQVKDRWSRYIGAMGLDAVAKQANSTIFLSGLGPLGVEIAKNIVLSGVKKITLHDEKNVELSDLSGQFFVGENDVGKNRVEACKAKIQQLNLYVKVEAYKGSLIDQMDSLFSSYQMVILVGQSLSIQKIVSKFCFSKGIKFISADNFGAFAKIFVSFGPNFEVLDKNGEEPQEVMLKSISNSTNGRVSLIDGSTHDFWDGDSVLIHSVKGMKGEKEGVSINGTVHKVKVIDSKTFEIGDTSIYSPHEGGGLAKQLKIPMNLQFQDLESNLLNPKFDQSLAFYDFEKLDNQKLSHLAFIFLDKFCDECGRGPKPWNFDDLEKFMNIVSKSEIWESLKEFKELKEKPSTSTFFKNFCLTISGQLPPFAAFLGGLVTQEIVKGLTQKFTPINQLFYPDVSDLIPVLSEYSREEIQKHQSETDDRYVGIRNVLGSNLLEKLRSSKVFMIGAGAIGCELLKNFSMIGLGTGTGHITVTDPDVIEVSNLNRQFLFREKHLRKPKSSTACAAAILMNPQLKGHISARLDKIHDGTAHIYNEEFFGNLTAVTNALDNVAARMYIDRRCVAALTPLLESGTLGPKGHVQVIIPKLTESYSSQKDPEEDKEIPHCTLKMFPEETLHCVEWARDLFGKYFTQKPKSLLKVLEDPSVDNQEIKIIQEAKRLAEKAPTKFIDCINLARQIFQKHFVNGIKQLLFTYPLDSKTKDGKDFWSLPKRPPSPVEFDPNNETHAACVSSIACLFAHTFGIEIPKNPRALESKSVIAKEAHSFKVKEFSPNSDKAKTMKIELDEESKGNKEKEEVKDEMKEKDSDGFSLVKQTKEVCAAKSISKVVASEFEKDNDLNFHIDFIHSMANVRAENYKLDKMDWITVKLKAGKIVPALATTTACVAGLQTIELLKVIKGDLKLDQYKNAFLNLAVNVMQLSEPGNVKTTTIREDLKVTIWDKWEVNVANSDVNLKTVISSLEEAYKLQVRDIFLGSKPILLSIHKESQKENIVKMALAELLALEGEEPFVDLIVLFSFPDKDEIIENTPLVRVNFCK